MSVTPASLDKAINDEEDTSLENFISADVSVENDITFKQLNIYLQNVLKCLTKRERDIILMRYYNDMTLEEVGNKLEVTRERVRQIEAKALVKLRHPRNTRKVKDYFE